MILLFQKLFCYLFYINHVPNIYFQKIILNQIYLVEREIVTFQLGNPPLKTEVGGVGPLSTPPLYYEEMSKKTNTTVESVLSFIAGFLSELKLLESKLLEVLPKKKNCYWKDPPLSRYYVWVYQKVFFFFKKVDLLY